MVASCLNCGSEFKTSPYLTRIGKGRYCSLKCYSDHNRVAVLCLVCKKSFSVTNSRFKNGRGKFCSKECMNTYTPKQSIVNCDYCGKEYKAKDSELNRNKGKYCSQTCFKKDYKNKYSGEKSSNWKGGKQRERHNGDYRYSEWRLLVYERDKFTCQECRVVGGKLNAHHIFSWSEFPELRYETWNGVTLCEKCHRKKHSKRRES